MHQEVLRQNQDSIRALQGAVHEQTLNIEQTRAEMRESSRAADERVGQLVGAIGEWVRQAQLRN